MISTRLSILLTHSRHLPFTCSGHLGRGLFTYIFALPSSSYLFTCLPTYSIRAAALSILCTPYGLNIRCPYKYVTVQCLYETSERSIINFFNTASWRSFQHDPVAVVIILIFIQMHVFANFWHYLQVEPKSGIVNNIAGSQKFIMFTFLCVLNNVLSDFVNSCVFMFSSIF